MAESFRADTVLALDFGTATTRAALFDVVEGRYRFLAAGEAPSTIEPPYHDAAEGMRHALSELQAISGRALLNDAARLIIPATPDGSGCDLFVATASAGPPVRALLVGLLPDVSLEYARRAAASSYVTILDTFSLGDRRRDEHRIDAVRTAKPDLILIAGGTDGGARDALLKLIETITLACHLLPNDAQTKVLYAGNPALTEKVNELLGSVAVVHHASNVQPELGHERLAPARAELTKIIEDLRLIQIGGFASLAPAAGGRILPTVEAEGQLLRYLSRLPAWARGVLGVHVGSASTTIATAIKGELYLSTRADLGVGVHASAALAEMPATHFTRWLPFECSETEWRDFILSKEAHPHTIPADANDLHREQALARQVMQAGLRRARALGQRGSGLDPHSEWLPWFDLIVATGAVLSRAPRPGLAALMLLDALQPTGVTTLMLDPYHLVAALGATTFVSPLTVAQVVPTGALLRLCQAVSVVGRARAGAVVCQARLVSEAGAETEAEVRAGTLEVLPLPLGQSGKLTLKPRAGMDVGFGPGRSKTLPVTGSALGVVVDGRGRPIVFPSAAEKRYEANQQWIVKMGGI